MTCARCALEFAPTYPIHVVRAWIGNSAAVARDYLQVTDQHFEQAAGVDVRPGGEEQKNAVQNLAQYTVVRGGNEQNPEMDKKQERPVFRGVSEAYDSLPESSVPPRGVERAKETPGKLGIAEAGGAESGAPGDERSCNDDPGLQEVVGGWEVLSAPLKAAILAMIRSAGNG